jgi:hypothetical protein
MRNAFDGIHLDPSQDTAELYQATLDLLSDMWNQVSRLKSACDGDPFASALLTDLETRVVAAGLLLNLKIKLDGGVWPC